MTVRFGSGNDPIITANTDTYLGGGGDDTYIVDPAFVTANAEITINDTQGANTLRLVGGIEIASSQVATLSNGTGVVELTLSNGATVFVDGASNFDFEVGGDNTGQGATTQPFSDFVEQTLGTTVPAAGDQPSQGGAVTIPNGSTGSTPEFSVSDNGPVEEGNTAEFTVELSDPQGTQTTVDYAISRDGGASADDHDQPTVGGSNTGLTGTLNFAAGETSKTIEVPFLLDNETPESGEAISVSLSNASGNNTSVGANGSASAEITNVDPFTLAPQGDTVREGNAITYTLNTAVAVGAVTDVDFQVVPGDAQAADQGTNDTNLNDFSQGAFNPSTVTIAQGDSQAQFTLSTQNEGLTELPEDFQLEATINGETRTVTTTLLDGSGQGDTFTLTENVDDFTGTPEDDLFTAVLGDTSAGELRTLNNGDILDGGDGRDILRVSQTDEDGDVFVNDASNIEVFEYSTSDEDEIYLGGMPDLEEIVIFGTDDWTNDFEDIQNLVDVTFRNNPPGEESDSYFVFDNSVTPGTVTVTFINNRDNDTEIDEYETDNNNDLIQDLIVNNEGVNEEPEIDDTTLMETLTINGFGTLYLDVNDWDSATSVDASGFTGLLAMDGSAGASSEIDVDNDFTYTGGGAREVLEFDPSSFDGTQTAPYDITIDTADGDDDVVIENPHANTYTVNLGSANDRLEVTNAPAADTFQANDTYDGGAGSEDRLAATDNAYDETASGAAANVSGFEELAISTALGANLAGGSDGNSTLELDTAFASFNDVVLEAGHTGDPTVTGLDSGASVTIADDSTGSTLDVDINNAGSNSSDVLDLVLTKDGDENFGGIDTSDIETVNIEADDAGDDADANHTANIDGSGHRNAEHHRRCRIVLDYRQLLAPRTNDVTTVDSTELRRRSERRSVGQHQRPHRQRRRRR